MSQMEQWLKDWEAKSKKYSETKERAENLLDEISDPDMGCAEGYCYSEVISAMMQFAEKEQVLDVFTSASLTSELLNAKDIILMLYNAIRDYIMLPSKDTYGRLSIAIEDKRIEDFVERVK